MASELIARLVSGNAVYCAAADPLRRETAENGQRPYAIVICCSDSRVIPERIFDAKLGELFVVRVAGNVLDRHQLGSVEYAAAHLGCKLVLVLGHTGGGAVGAALKGERGGYIGALVDEILEAIGEERDPDRAAEKNVRHVAARLKAEFAEHPEIERIEVVGAMYSLNDGAVRFLAEEEEGA